VVDGLLDAQGPGDVYRGIRRRGLAPSRTSRALRLGEGAEHVARDEARWAMGTERFTAMIFPLSSPAGLVTGLLLTELNSGLTWR